MTRKAATPPPAKAAYLVLGMHRSGTSAVTQLLALAGAQLPIHLIPGDEHNAKGYFEPWKIAVLNDQRLQAGGGSWDDVFAFPFRPLPELDERRWLARAVNLVREEYEGAETPLLKDPRITVLLPFWRTVLDEFGLAPRCVIPVREPLAVAGSLARRNGFDPRKSVLLWTAYMLAAEAHSRDLPRAFVGYDALLGDWRAQAAAIETAHGARLPALTDAAEHAIDQFLTPDLRHHAGGALADLGWAGALAARVHAWFAEAAAGGKPDPSPLADAAAELARRQQEFGFLVSAAHRDHDAARAALADTRDELKALIDEKLSLEARLETRLAAMEQRLEAMRQAMAGADRALDALLAS